MIAVEKSYLLKKVGSEDMASLKKIYASTRQAELDQLTDWTASMKQQFIDHQFNAQHTYYQNNYTTAHFYKILQNQTTIGRLYIDENFSPNNIRIIDITLLPSWRNKGIGREILGDIIETAQKTDKKVSIHVESFNPAMRLYFSLGFEKVTETNGVYHLLEWKK